MADTLSQIKGLTAIQIQSYNNAVQGTQDTYLYVDKSGKIVSAAQVNGTPIALGSADIKRDVLSRQQTLDFVTANLTEINKQVKAQLGVTKTFASASAAIAPEAAFTKESERVGNYLKNTDAASFNFRVANEANVQQFKSLKAPSTANQVIVFPSDLIVESNGSGVQYSQDTIRIKALKYVPPQKDFLKGQRNENIYKTGIISNNQVFKGYETRDYDYRGEVILPMPLSVKDAVGAEWGISAMNTLALGLFSAVRDKYEGGAGGIGALLRSGFRNFSSTEAWIALADAYAAGGNGQLREQIVNDVTRDIVNSLGIQVDPLQALARSTGSVVNNNAELLFKGPKLRSFDFTWKLSPRNQADSSRIRKMVKWFKVNSLPYISESGAIFMETPNVFVVQYTKANNQRNEALPQPKICALLDFRVDYTPDGVGWAAYGEDSQPVTSIVTCVFHELTPLFANEYSLTADNDVGF